MACVVDEKTWIALLERDDYCCLNCNSIEGLQPAHYIPRSLGGTEHIDNLMLLCNECHRRQEDGKLIVKRIKDRFYFGDRK
jgi:5-methylcytosine-specific restriction endonuclease McrA